MYIYIYIYIYIYVYIYIYIYFSTPSTSFLGVINIDIVIHVIVWTAVSGQNCMIKISLTTNVRGPVLESRSLRNFPHCRSLSKT